MLVKITPERIIYILTPQTYEQKSQNILNAIDHLIHLQSFALSTIFNNFSWYNVRKKMQKNLVKTANSITFEISGEL